MRDRLVQRAILDYLVSKKKFPVENAVSFGFIKGRGTNDAIAEAIRLRSRHEWVVKTDIEKFFDRVPREYLKERLREVLGSHSLVPLIENVIEREVRAKSIELRRINLSGIRRGQGIRQGMPLSPLLANLILSNFDRALIRNGYSAIRYADDLALFFSSESACDEGYKFVSEQLAKLRLTIPAIGCLKTEKIAPKQGVDFLGREIVYLDKVGGYVARVSRRQIEKIKAKLVHEYTATNYISQGKLFSEFCVDLSQSIRSYLGIYRNAQNFARLDSDLRGLMRSITTSAYTELFGADIIDRLNAQQRRFIGIDNKLTVDPVEDSDV